MPRLFQPSAIRAGRIFGEIMNAAQLRSTQEPKSRVHRAPLSSRDPHLDTLRGLACVLVVAFHVNQGIKPQLGSTSLDFINDVLIMMRLPLFTFLSGYLYAMRTRQRGRDGEYLLRRLRLLLLPLMSVTLIHVAVQNHVPGTHLYTPSGDIWRALIFPFEHLWFLQAMALIVTAVALLERLEWLSTANRWGLVFIVANIAYLSPRFSIDLFSINGAIYLSPYFLLGLGAKRFEEDIGRSDIGVLALIVCLGAFIVKGMAVSGTIALSQQMLPKLHLVGGLSVCLVLIRTHFSWSGLAKLGTFSYPIYLFHPFGTAGSRIGLNYIGVKAAVPHILTGLAVGILLPLIIAACAEQFRFSRLLLLGR